MSSTGRPKEVLRRPGPPTALPGFAGVQIDDERLAAVLSPDSKPLVLYEGCIHAEGPVWQPEFERLLFSDVPNRRLLAWSAADGRVEAAIDPTHFMNGNALLPSGAVVHCEHGRRCISRSAPDLAGEPEPIVTHYEGRRLNSPNDVTVAPDGTVWFTDPIFGIVMPSQGSLAEPQLDHRSVYRFDPATGALGRMADFEQPNGLAFTVGGRTLYVSDTAKSLGEVPGFEPGRTHGIEAFDVAPDGALSGRRFFCHTDHGYPDGLKVDGRGWVWTSAADGIHVWAPDRRRLGFIPLPVVVSNLTLGGPDGRRLFVAATKYLLAFDLAA